MVHKHFCCSECGGLTGYRSHTRNFAEKYLLPLVLLAPVRCADCYKRTYVSVFTRMDEAPIEQVMHGKKAA